MNHSTALKTSASTTSAPPVPLLSPGAKLIARRFSFGLKPGLARDIMAAGNGRNWFLAQLDPGSVVDAGGDEIDSWFAYLQHDPAELYQRARFEGKNISLVMASLSRRTVARRLRSKRQVHEVMVDFWSNLLNVPLRNRRAAFYRAAYDQTIRTYALTSFEQLLQHAITHPAMGINLNNNVSTKKSPNENLGRELLELHTVGVDGGYTEDDVKASAKILTGYRAVAAGPAAVASYDPASHWTGRVTVMGFSAENADPDGRQVTMDYLSYLAHHPSTAKRIARRLCVKFVRDDPSDSHVDAVTRAYLDNGTAIAPTLLALIDHPDFKASAGLKLRTPQEDWQATMRAMGVKPLRPTRDASFVNAMRGQYHALGNAPYEWDPPNGYPETNAAWSSAGRMLNSFDLHQSVATGAWLTLDVQVPTLAGLVSSRPTPTTLQKLIDAYALRLLGEPATQSTSLAVSQVVGHSLNHVITTREADARWTRVAIVATLFDSPQHMYR